MSYTLIERCCGSSALTLHLLGARRSILPYQGGKWRLRKQLGEIVERLGFTGTPDRVVLTDPGPWGLVMGVLLDRPLRSAVADKLADLAEEDPKDAYEDLQNRQTPFDPIQFATEFLFLQRLSHSGKAVGISLDGCWKSPGLNRSSAYGLKATGRFGAIKPMIPSLVEVLRSYDEDLAQLPPGAVLANRSSAYGPAGLAEVPKTSHTVGEAESGVPTVEYVDPPYQGTTHYPNGHLGRAHVIELARAAQRRGAAVLVSEREPISDLVNRGWTAEPLRIGPASGTSPFRSRSQEWVTFIGASR